MMSNTIKHILCAGALCVALGACSDWDDHYDAETAVLPGQQLTLWEHIAQDRRLTEFADLLRKTGYDERLKASQTYTVWAPANGTFGYEALAGTNSEQLVKEFVNNHIARNNWTASGAVDVPVFMLNGKVMDFRGTTMQGVPVQQASVAGCNGTMYLLDGKIPFYPNIYESLLKDDATIGAVSGYYHSFDQRTFNAAASAPGPVIDGEQTYLDSVFYDTNDLYGRFNAYIAREDSNYTMLLPTNTAWQKAQEAIRPCFNYLPKMEWLEDAGAVNEKKVTAVELKDAAALQDSLVNMYLMRDLFFNNNMYGNKVLNTLAQGETLQCDSLRNTIGAIFYAQDATRLFEQARRVDKSNGAVWLTDELRLPAWLWYNSELQVEAEFDMYMAGVFNTAGNTPNKNRVQKTQQNPEVPGNISNGYYLEAEPSASSTNPEVVFYLPGVLSTEYSMYAVMVPSNITNTTRTPLPNRMIVTMGYADGEGKLQETRLRNPESGSTIFVSDPTKIDTLYLGDFTFPVAYRGVGDSRPHLRMRSSVNNADYDRTLRIDCLILRPKELDTYLKEHPEYKYK